MLIEEFDEAALARDEVDRRRVAAVDIALIERQLDLTDVDWAAGKAGSLFQWLLPFMMHDA